MKNIAPTKSATGPGRAKDGIGGRAPRLYNYPAEGPH